MSLTGCSPLGIGESRIHFGGFSYLKFNGNRARVLRHENKDFVLVHEEFYGNHLILGPKSHQSVKVPHAFTQTALQDRLARLPNPAAVGVALITHFFLLVFRLGIAHNGSWAAPRST